MSFKLYYFNTRGLVEPIRIMLSYGGIDFEDIRAPLEKFPAILPEDMKQSIAKHLNKNTFSFE